MKNKTIKRFTILWVAVLFSISNLIGVFGANSMFSVLYANAAYKYERYLDQRNGTSYKNLGGTWGGGCGLYSICNAIYCLNGSRMPIEKMADWAIPKGYYVFLYDSSLGRYRSYTASAKLFSEAAKQYGSTYGFTYAGETAENNNSFLSQKLKTHLRNGGVAVGYVYGHYIALVDYNSSNNQFYVIDSYIDSSTAQRPARGLPTNGWVSESYLRTHWTAKVTYCYLYSSTSNPTPPPEPIWTPVNEDYVVSVSGLNFRTNYNISATLVSGVKLFQGDTVYVKETAVVDDGRTWAHITFKGKEGYCCMKDGGSYYLQKQPAPGKPTISVKAGLSGQQTTFSWSKTENTDHYDVYIYKNTDQNHFKFIPSIKATSYSYTLEAGNYQFAIASVSANGQKWTFSDRKSFTVTVSKPDKPTLTVRASNSVSDTSFSWNVCGNTNNYELKIYQSGNLYKTIPNLTGTSTSVRLPVGSYTATITANNTASGDKTVSDSKSFSVTAITPAKPVVKVSAGTSDSNTSFSWNSCKNADEYTIQISYSNGTSHSTKTVTGTSYSVKLPDGNYKVTVTSRFKQDNTTAVSDAQTFTVIAIPSKPTLTVTAGTNSTATKFSWNSCKNTNEYTLNIYNSSTNKLYKSVTQTDTSYSQVITDAGNYYAIVTARNTTYKQEVSSEKAGGGFTVKAVPSKPKVTVNAGNSATNTIINWNDCTDTDSYVLTIKKKDGTVYKTETLTDSVKTLVLPTGDYNVTVTAKNATYSTQTASDQVQFTVIPVVPSTPDLNVAEGNNHTNSVFSWNKCQYTDKYTLTIQNTDTGKTVVSETLTALSYSIILSAGNYSAQVRAINATENTYADSAKVSFNVKNVDVTAFDATVTGRSDSQVALEWTASQNATKYDVYRYENGAFTYAGSTAGLQFTDVGLYIGTAYEYYVTASNEWSRKDSNHVNTETLQIQYNGSGTDENPYLINTSDDLVLLSELVNDPTTSALFGSFSYKQTADFDLNGINFTPIGTLDTPFKGHYDGSYYTVTGLNVTSNDNYAGLFGYCGSAVIENLVVYGTVATSKSAAGGIAGEIGYSGRIENCAFYGDVSGTNHIGGIVGNLENGGTLIRCYQIGAVSGSKNVGGIAGQAKTGKNNNSQNISISYCYHAGGSVSGTEKVSGVVGNEDIGTTKSCSVTYRDCYYLKGTASSGANGGTNAGVVVVNATVLMNLTATLGEPYADGSEYPIFVWESELYGFKGRGTASSPFQIGTAQELKILSEYVNDVYLNARYGNAHYVQTADIDLGNAAFTPIGNANASFNGSYDGGFHSIKGLDVSVVENSGLFGYADSITIRNLVVDGTVKSSGNSGGLIGTAAVKADLAQCAFNGTVQGKIAGGLAGQIQNSGKIVSSYQIGAVTGTTGGGLIGGFTCSEGASEESLIIESSYHGAGTVSGNGVLGSASGAANAVFINNSYYLKTAAASDLGATAVNQTVLGALAATLDTPFTDSSSSPVFSWQIAKYEFAGKGTEDDPYLIGTADDLIALQEYINNPGYHTAYSDAHYLQISDIDLGDMDWTAIGMSEEMAFNGVYNGGYFTVRGLNACGETFSGLFGQVGATNNGKNAGVYNIIIEYGTSSSATGVTGGTAAVLMDGATVDSCSVIGDLTGTTGVGGVIGIVRRSGTITNSYHNGVVTGKSKVGGIIGTVESGTAVIENCYHTEGNIVGTASTGAIVGSATGTAKITNCYYLKGTASGAVNSAANAGTTAVNATVLTNLAPTLGDAYTYNIYEQYYNNGYPVFAEQFRLYNFIRYVTGDLNDDGELTIADAVLLKKWLLAIPNTDIPNWVAGDYNDDGKLNAIDLTMMKRELMKQ